MIIFIVASSAVMQFIVAFGLNKKVSWGTFSQHLYLNVYAEFDSILVFLHDYHWACEISTVRTLTLRLNNIFKLFQEYH